MQAPALHRVPGHGWVQPSASRAGCWVALREACDGFVCEPDGGLRYYPTREAAERGLRESPPPVRKPAPKGPADMMLEREEGLAGRYARGERCHSQRDGDCVDPRCPQNRDGEPRATGRHCPLDP